MIVVFEGIDGCGKGTQIQLLSKIMKYERKNYPDRKGVFGELFNRVLKGSTGEFFDGETLFTMFLMDMLKDRNLLQKYKKDEKSVILLDRYAHSTLAYQSAQGVDYDRGKRIIEHFGLVKPDIVIILDITPEESMERIKGEEIFENAEFLEKVRENYKRIYSDKFFAERMYWVSGIRYPDEINREIVDILTLHKVKAPQ
ncbi:MAG: dTMP kinase [Candidatus Micrarchaeia archaeon]